MTFLETFLSIEDDYNDFDIMNQKINIFIESSYREYMVNREEAELKVLTESGTYDDLIYLYQEAEETFKERIKKTIAKIGATLKQFIDKILNKFRSLFNSKKSDEAIDKLEDKVKKSPTLKKEKIEVKDTREEEKSILQAVDEIDKKLAEIQSKSHKCTQKDLDDIKRINENYKKRRKAAAGAVITLSFLSGIALYKHNKKNAENKLNKISNQDDFICDVIEEGDDFTIKVIAEAYNQKSSFMKDYASAVMQGVTDIWNKLRGKVELKDPKEIPN